MIVSITRLHLRSARFLVPFIFYALRSTRQSKRSPGNVATDVWRDPHGGYWTRTVWADEAALRAFMMSGAHRKAMPKLLDWCDAAALVRWEQENAGLPSWEEAHHRLVTQGRPSKVRHPSAMHQSLDYPPPRQR